MREPVIIPAILLSDSAIREQGTNKLTLVGCFSHWNGPAFPRQCQPFCVTVLLSNLRVVGEPISIVIRLEDSNHHCLWSATATFPLPNVTPVDTLDISFPAVGVAFPVAGTYVFTVLVDGEAVGQRTVCLRSE